MLSVVCLVVVEKTVIIFRLNKASLWNIGIRGLLLYESLAFEPKAYGLEDIIFLGHIEILVPEKQFEIILRQVSNFRLMK